MTRSDRTLFKQAFKLPVSPHSKRPHVLASLTASSPPRFLTFPSLCFYSKNLPLLPVTRDGRRKVWHSAVSNDTSAVETAQFLKVINGVRSVKTDLTFLRRPVVPERVLSSLTRSRDPTMAAQKRQPTIEKNMRNSTDLAQFVSDRRAFFSSLRDNREVVYDRPECDCAGKIERYAGNTTSRHR